MDDVIMEIPLQDLHGSAKLEVEELAGTICFFNGCSKTNSIVETYRTYTQIYDRPFCF